MGIFLLFAAPVRAETQGEAITRALQNSPGLIQSDMYYMGVGAYRRHTCGDKGWKPELGRQLAGLSKEDYEKRFRAFEAGWKAAKAQAATEKVDCSVLRYLQQ